MCKLMILKGIENSALALDFMKAVAPTMSIQNNDGIGYSAINSQNKLFMEKWHNNKSFLDTEDVLKEEDLSVLDEVLKPFKKKINIKLPDINYTNYGEVTRDDLKTVTMHTRFATCGREFKNTHPFVDQETSLIHNGVINNHYALSLNKISTCDSENALQLYIKNSLGTKALTEDFQGMIDKLRGYWAFAFLAKDSNGQYVVDIVREGAPLYWAMLPELGVECVVFATTQEIIETGVKTLGLPERTKIFALTESNYHRFNAVTGEFIENFPLDKSALNTVSSYYTKDYSKSWNNYGKTSKDDADKSIDEIYETYTAEQLKKTEEKEEDKFTGIEDGEIIDSFYDTNEPLLDRLYEYDALMSSTYGKSFEDMPPKMIVMIETREEEEYINFDDVLDLIEIYEETGSTTQVAVGYLERKRA